MASKPAGQKANPVVSTSSANTGLTISLWVTFLPFPCYCPHLTLATPGLIMATKLILSRCGGAVRHPLPILNMSEHHMRTMLKYGPGKKGKHKRDAVVLISLLPPLSPLTSLSTLCTNTSPPHIPV